MTSAAAVMRKTVTVLFCDVAGSTELGERLDPEALRAVMAPWFDATRTPVERWRVVSTIAGATPYARRLDVPLIGRADELAFLESEVDAAVRDRACRLVTVCAPAGVGKSRLAQELLARVDADVLSARCVS